MISGQSRAVTGNKGVAPGQGLNGTNRWISTALPAALTLQLAKPAPITQLQLVFDTGMHRKLNFNPVGAPHDAMYWSPQPETVRDYVIEGRSSTAGAEWVVLCNVTGNYLRRRIHSLPCSSKPGPAPPAPPPAIATGALVADLCTGATGQMWSMDSQTGTVSTVVAATKYCLGYSQNLSAFGGKGRAVVALPCDHQPAGPAAWSLKYLAGPRNGTGALLQAVKGAPCLVGPGAACDAERAHLITIEGAGDAGFNGVYTRDEHADVQQLMFKKDTTHQLYVYDGMWHLGELGTSVAYTSTAHGLDGPPVPGGWQTGAAGVAPPPRSITCQGAGPEPDRAYCSCVHVVACVACHSEEYFAGTSVELTDCAADVTHIRWHQLEMDSSGKGGAMLMSEGLCLGLPAPSITGSSAGAGGQSSLSASAGPTTVRPSNDRELRPLGRAPATPLSEVRVTVSATNGIAFAVVNEVRLYDQQGEHPFPVQPKTK